MESYHVAGPSVIVAPGTQGHVPSPPARAIVRARHRDGTPLVTEWPRLLCAALVAVGPAAVARAQAPESCAALAQFGAYDTRPGLKDAERGEAFRNWVCQANIALESDLRQAGSAVGIAPEVLEATLGYDPNGAQDFLDWKHAFCAAARTDQRLADKVSGFVKGVTPTVVTALAACDKPPGLHVRLEQTAQQCNFLVRLGWTPMPDVAAPTDVQVIATSPTVVCQPTPLQTDFTVKGPTDLSCTRHDDTAMVVMVAAPSAHVTRLDHLMELPQALPNSEDLLGGDYSVDISWRERSGRYGTPTNDVWHLDLSNGTCRITGSGTAHTPRSAWFTQARATCAPTEISFTGYRSYDPAAHGQSQFTLSLRSDDNGATFTGSGTDSLGNVAVQATAKHKGEMPPPDQAVCKP